MARQMEEHPEVIGVPAGSLEDKALTLAFQTGDKGAYQAIYDRYSTRVYNVCRRMLGHDDAQEAAQETFLRVYQALGRFNGRYQLGPWITRIATNVCLDHLRAKARRPSDPVPNEVFFEDNLRADEHSEPERLLIRDSESRQVRKVLAKLPPMHRAAIVLRDFEGLSYQEVAIALSITECQAKALIHRARQNFKRSWSKSLSVLVPWRLVDRLRGLDASVRDHSAEVLSVTQSVGTCTGMLQQCGQYVGQHVATVVTAAIVGTAAGAVSHAATRPPRVEVQARTGVTVSGSMTADRSSKVLPQTKEPRRKETPATTSVQQQEVAEPLPPGPTEAPPIEPTPEETDPAVSPKPEPSPSPSASEMPKASPQPFAPVVGFDYGRPIPGRVPKSHSATVSCSKDLLEQQIETVIEDDDSAATYPALLQLHWGPSTTLSLELTIWKNGAELYYSGNGSLVEGSYPEGQREMRFMGNYGTYDDRARSMDLPTSGRFTAALTLDCAALSVITESVVLGA